MSPIALYPAAKRLILLIYGVEREIGEKADDPVSMYLSDIATVPVNLAGIPAISIPSGFDHQGLPIGVQLLGPHFSESLLFKTAYAFETETGLVNLHPEAYQAQTV